MPAISPRSPGHDLEHGTTRRKRHTRQFSDTTVPAIPTRPAQRPLGSPWLKFSSRRAPLVLAIVCVCLAGVVFRSAWLPVLARTSALVYSPAEATNLAQPDRGSAVAANLDTGSPYVRQTSVPLRLHGQSDTRRFLTFLPHSGFSNQRIALENAMLLAYILNCTLVAPPVRLGEPLPYRPFDTLVKWNEFASRPRPDHCAQYPDSSRCMDVNSHVQMSWNNLVDLTSVQKELGLDIIFMHGSQTPLQFLYQMGVPEQSIAFLKDEVMYQHLIYDSPGHVGAGSRYVDGWHLDYLRGVLESSDVIHFGTLFGSGRLKIQNPAHVATRRMIHDSMVISHPGVLDTANVIRQRIAGSSADGASYVAVHVRVTGRKFKTSARANGRLVWWELVTWLGLSPNAGTELEREYLRARGRYGRPPAPPNLAAFKTSTRSASMVPQIASSGKLRCMRRSRPQLTHLEVQRNSSNIEIPLFIATDAPNPWAHPALGLFFATFPCVYVLDDFQTDLKMLDEFRDVDGLPIGKFLVPLVDAVVAGRATNVFGTANSTFSDYITRTLHPAYSKDT